MTVTRLKARLSISMSRYSLLMLALALLAFVQPGLAQRNDQILLEGFEALYNLDFDVAETHFRRLAELDPPRPEPWNQLAATLWLKIVAGQEKLNLESFSGASLGTDDSSDAVGAQEEKQLRDTIATAVSKADALLARNRQDVQALYAKGVAKAQLAAFEAVAKRSYFAAYRTAREARDLHSEVLKLDPNFKDAALTIGVYDYAVASIPGWLKFFLGAFGLRGGDKERGLATIVDVARSGKSARTDAKMLLIVMYNREKKYEESVALLSDLQSRYPRNYLLELSKASVYSRIKEWDQAINSYRSVLQKVEAGNQGYKHLDRSKVLLLLAKANVDQGSVPEGMAIYQEVISDGRSSDNDRANARLWLGRLYDLMKDRTKAVAEYDAILSLKCDPRLKAQAQKYKKDPFGANGKF